MVTTCQKKIPIDSEGAIVAITEECINNKIPLEDIPYKILSMRVKALFLVRYSCLSLAN